MLCADNVTCQLFQLESRLTLVEQQQQQNQTSLDTLTDAVDTAWVLICGMLVFLMQLGFAMLESGMVRERSVIATYMKNLLDLSLGTLSGAV